MKRSLLAFFALTFTLSSFAAETFDFTKVEIDFDSYQRYLSEEDKKAILEGAEVYAGVKEQSIGDRIFYGLGCPGFHGCSRSYSNSSEYKLPVTVDTEGGRPVFASKNDITAIKVKGYASWIELRFTSKVAKERGCQVTLIYNAETSHYAEKLQIFCPKTK